MSRDPASCRRNYRINESSNSAALKTRSCSLANFSRHLFQTPLAAPVRKVQLKIETATRYIRNRYSSTGPLSAMKMKHEFSYFSLGPFSYSVASQPVSLVGQQGYLDNASCNFCSIPIRSMWPFACQADCECILRVSLYFRGFSEKDSGFSRNRRQILTLKKVVRLFLKKQRANCHLHSTCTVFNET